MDLGVVYGLETEWQLLAMVHSMMRKSKYEPSEEEAYEVAEAIGQIVNCLVSSKQAVAAGENVRYAIHVYTSKEGAMTQVERA
ncbi:MAG: hypothetical protein ACP5K9_02305 [Candidatus Micrarchaeia archaeon]